MVEEVDGSDPGVESGGSVGGTVRGVSVVGVVAGAPGNWSGIGGVGDNSNRSPSAPLTNMKWNRFHHCADFTTSR